jgi:hypothetical protein
MTRRVIPPASPVGGPLQPGPGPARLAPNTARHAPMPHEHCRPQAIPSGRGQVKPTAHPVSGRKRRLQNPNHQRKNTSSLVVSTWSFVIAIPASSLPVMLAVTTPCRVRCPRISDCGPVTRPPEEKKGAEQHPTHNGHHNAHTGPRAFGSSWTYLAVQWQATVLVQEESRQCPVFILLESAWTLGRMRTRKKVKELIRSLKAGDCLRRSIDSRHRAWDRKAFVTSPSAVTSPRPAILMVLNPYLAPFIGQSLPLVTVTRHAMVIIQVATEINLSRGFWHCRDGQAVRGRRCGIASTERR